MGKIFVAAVLAAMAVSPAGAATWFDEDFESYVDEADFKQSWLTDYGAGMPFFLEGGIKGPKATGGAKTNRRDFHSLIPHIQAADGGAGMTSVNGTNAAPLVLEFAYRLNDNIDIARAQDFFVDLAKGEANTPRRVAGVGTPRDVIAFGAFSAFNDAEGGYRQGLMYYDGLNWTHLPAMEHATGWNFVTVTIRTTSVEIVYVDETQSNGIQTQILPRAYRGDFDTMGINADVCNARVQLADAFTLSDGVFIPEPGSLILLSAGLGLALSRRRSGQRRGA